MPSSFPTSISIAALFSAAAFGQSPAATPAFEVASVKPAGPINPVDVASGKLHVGMSITAGRVDIGFLSLANLIAIAYKVKPYQLFGPSWMSTERFDVLAKLPEGATKEEVPEMLKTLLAERFKLAIHKDSKEQSVFALLVGKNGPKLKEAEPDAPGTSGEVAATSTGSAQVNISRPDSKGGVVVSTGQTGPMRMEMGPNGTMRMEMKRATMAVFADMLARFVDRPVVDQTGLSGNYQVSLDLPMDVIRGMARNAGVMMPGPSAAVGGDAGRAPADAASDPSESSIFASVQQMGLKLEPRKLPVDLIVIDHLEKTPSEN